MGQLAFLEVIPQDHLVEEIQPPLLVAIAEANIGDANLLLQNRNNVDVNQNYLYFAVQSGSEAMVNLISNRFDRRQCMDWIFSVVDGRTLYQLANENDNIHRLLDGYINQND
ncbi:MAG: hypothetical protein A2Y14_01935 [Verrucomicrobia bacterium GWF2_51_19]|nr:MAG: hypothetical protein A2Y14_01935 [Verrucomicrobia bacterium GWF2_51_19]HCJ11861.1 hypothetical protein [Opitutae bacterium]